MSKGVSIITFYLLYAIHARPLSQNPDENSYYQNYVEQTYGSDEYVLVQDPKQSKESEDLLKNDILGPPLSDDDIIQNDRDGNDTYEDNLVEQPLSPDLFEGDLIGVKLVKASNARNAFINTGKWPEGKVPYVISDQVDSQMRSILQQAMNVIKEISCITFIPRESSHSNYVHVTTGHGCSSKVGMSGTGGQHFSLGRGCGRVGVAIHELMHSLGFVHEHARPDRDDHIKILFENIQSGMETFFKSYSSQDVNTQDFPYDISSILHYGPRAGTKNGRNTIEPLRRGEGQNMGNRKKMTDLDVQKLNKLYNCEGKKGGGTTKPTPGPVPTQHSTTKIPGSISTRRSTSKKPDSTPPPSCLEMDTTYQSSSLVTGMYNPQSSWQDCQKSCKNYTGCNYWTWADEKKCYLKKERKFVKTMSNHISGSRDC